jgi:hypothetical protein
MAERGKQAYLLNVVTDELGGPYDGVLAMVESRPTLCCARSALP